jgi:hypothetical protein
MRTLSCCRTRPRAVTSLYKVPIIEVSETPSSDNLMKRDPQMESFILFYLTATLLDQLVRYHAALPPLLGASPTVASSGPRGPNDHSHTTPQLSPSRQSILDRG